MPERLRYIRAGFKAGSNMPALLFRANASIRASCFTNFTL